MDRRGESNHRPVTCHIKMETPRSIIGVAGLPLDPWEKNVFTSFFPETPPSLFKRGNPPIRTHEWGGDFTFALTWIAISFLGASAATFFKAFLQALGTELGKSLIRRWTERSDEKEKKVQDKTWNNVPDVTAVIIYEHDCGIHFLIELPRIGDDKFDAIQELPTKIDEWLSKSTASPNDTRVVVCYFTDHWNLIEKKQWDEKNYNLHLYTYDGGLDD